MIILFLVYWYFKNYYEWELGLLYHNFQIILYFKNLRDKIQYKQNELILNENKTNEKIEDKNEGKLKKIIQKKSKMIFKKKRRRRN